MKKIILILIITLGLASCEKEERVIDNSKISLDLYLADSITNDVSIYDYPAMEVVKSDLLKSNGVEINSPITTIREFQRKVYFFVPNEDKVIVFDAIADTLITINEFPFGSGPIDISFANPADGIVIFRSAPYIIIYDLVFNKIARTLADKSIIKSASTFQSYSYLCESQTKNVAVFDNRSYTTESKVELTGNPVLSTVTSESELLVVTLGTTTQEPNGEPITTPTQIHFLNLENKSLRISRDLGDNVIPANEVIPNDIISTSFGYSYITSKKGLLRLDTRNNGAFIDVSKRIFEKIEYSAQLKSLLLLEKTGTEVNLAQGSAVNGVVVGSIGLPSNTNTFHMSY